MTTEDTNLKGRDKRNSKRTARILKRIDSGKTTADEQTDRAESLLIKGENMSDKRYVRRVERAAAVNTAAQKSKKSDAPKTTTEKEQLDKPKPVDTKQTKTAENPAQPQVIEEPVTPKEPIAAQTPSIEIYENMKFSQAFNEHRQRFVSAGDNATPEDAFFVWNGALYSARSGEDKEFNYTPTDDMKKYVKPRSYYKKSTKNVDDTKAPEYKQEQKEEGTSTETQPTPPPIQTPSGIATYDKDKGGYVLPSATIDDAKLKSMPKTLGPNNSAAPVDYMISGNSGSQPYIPSYIPEDARENYLMYDTFVVGEDGKDYKVNKKSGQVRPINIINIGREIALPYSIKDGKIYFSDASKVQPVQLDNESTHGVYSLSIKNRLSGSTLTHDPATDEYYIKSFGGSFRKAGPDDFSNPDLYSEILGVLRSGK